MGDNHMGHAVVPEHSHTHNSVCVRQCGAVPVRASISYVLRAAHVLTVARPHSMPFNASATLEQSYSMDGAANAVVMM